MGKTGQICRKGVELLAVAGHPAQADKMRREASLLGSASSLCCFPAFTGVIKGSEVMGPTPPPGST